MLPKSILQWKALQTRSLWLCNQTGYLIRYRMMYNISSIAHPAHFLYTVSRIQWKPRSALILLSCHNRHHNWADWSVSHAYAKSSELDNNPIPAQQNWWPQYMSSHDNIVWRCLRNIQILWSRTFICAACKADAHAVQLLALVNRSTWLIHCNCQCYCTSPARHCICVSTDSVKLSILSVSTSPLIACKHRKQPCITTVNYEVPCIKCWDCDVQYDSIKPQKRCQTHVCISGQHIRVACTETLLTGQQWNVVVGSLQGAEASSQCQEIVQR